MRGVVLGLLILGLAVALCPEPPHEFPHGYDRSYLLALSEAHAQDLVFGEQLNYPYGPLAWLWHPLPNSGAVGTGVVVQLLGFALFLLVLGLLAWRTGGRWLAGWCLAVIGAAGVIDPEALWLVQLEFGVPVLGLLAFATPAARRLGVLLALAFLAAVLLLVKLDGGVYAIVLCAALSVHLATRRGEGAPAPARVLLLPPLVFLVSLAALFALESGRLDALPTWLMLSVPVLVGYKEMSIDGDPANLVPPLVALGLAFVLLPLLARDRRALVPALLIVALPAFMLWQRVAMRQDAGHQVSLLPRLAVLMLFPLLAARGARDRWTLVVFQVALLVAGQLVAAAQKEHHVRNLVERVTGRQARQTAAALSDWDRTLRALERESESNGEPLRLGTRARLIVKDAAVDAVPWEIERVMANGWRWTPRPALQSGNAYMPALDGRDGEHFASEAAPPFVLASLQAIDGRHAFTEAPLTWRALLDRYDLRTAFPGVLLLERRPAPRFLPPRPLGTVQAGWDEPLAVPETDGLLVLACDIDTGLLGGVAGLFYRNTPVLLDVTYRSGLRLRVRAVRSNLASGAIVSPLPTYLDSLRLLLATGPGEVDRLVSISLHTDAPWQYGDALQIEWLELLPDPAQLPWRRPEPAPDPDAPAWSILGDGCEGADEPTLSLSGTPRVGQTTDVIIEGAPPRRPVALMLGGPAVELRRRKSTLFVDPDRMLFLVAGTDADGTAILSLPIPDDARLAGRRFTLQFATPAGGGKGWRLGCGLEVTLAP